VVLFWSSKVKVTRQINAHTVNANIFWTGRPMKFKLGTQTEHEDQHQRQAPWPPRSKVKVARSRDASDRCWPTSRERNVLKTPKLVGRLPTSRQQYLQVSRSKVKVIWSIALHNNTSFRTTIAFYSHSLGGDTSTITLPPQVTVIRYSLGGDTDKSNTAWVCTLVITIITIKYQQRWINCQLIS